jgi:hypothetical protein
MSFRTQVLIPVPCSWPAPVLGCSGGSGSTSGRHNDGSGSLTSGVCRYDGTGYAVILPLHEASYQYTAAKPSARVSLPAR